MWEAIKDLAGSKKALGTLAGILIVIFGKIGLSISDEQVWAIVALVASFVTGQGLSDFGKAKAQIEPSPGS